MSTVESRIATVGVLFLLSLVFGLWLSSAGRPLNTAIFTVHKLIALAAAVLAAATIYQLLKAPDVKNFQQSIVIAAGVLLLVTFASGAWLSIDKAAQPAVLAVHRITPPMSVVAAVAAIYLLAKY